MGRTFILLAAVMLVVAMVAACGGDPSPSASVDPAASLEGPADSPEPSPSAKPSIDPEGELCLRVAEVEQRLAALRSVELRLPNRVALEIELDKLQVAYGELEDVARGEREAELRRPLTRLGYRLGELQLAVEDFRTNTRPRRAAPHVEEDSQKMADELNAFVILSRC